MDVQTEASGIDRLFQQQLSVCPQLATIELHILTHRHIGSTHYDTHTLAYDEKKSLIYFRLYTVPLLECAGLLAPGRYVEALRWGMAQFCFGMHIRYIDSVIDADEKIDALIMMQLASSYLVRAQQELMLVGVQWDVRLTSLYQQLFLYETEVRTGYCHSYGSLWRRVSPLVLVWTALEQRNFISSTHVYWFRQYLSWSLLVADCDDGLRDYGAGIQTPFVRLLREALNGTANNIEQLVYVFDHMNVFLAQQELLLAGYMQIRYPLWSLAVQYLRSALQSPLRTRAGHK